MMQRTDRTRHSFDTRGIPCRIILMGILTLLLMASHPAAGLLEVNVIDGAIIEKVARPDTIDPGPIYYETSDGLTFSSGLTDVAAVWYAEIASATNNTSASAATIQGGTQTFSDWFYGKQGSAARFGSFNTTGAYDADAASYAVPLLFNQSSQGTLTITSYGTADPSADRTQATYYWAYDSPANRYVVGTSKDLSLESQVAPISDSLGTTYSRTLETNAYVVTAVGAAPDYLPTLNQGIHLPLVSLPASVDWYVLMDTPAGVHEDTYSYELRVTAQGL